ncbi:MAG TPA: hypothetical protein VL943_07110, partial [Niabella sp.]|nr:hypothetical protein [Niabella sp.]
MFILINIAVVSFFVFFYPFSFNYETHITYQYYLTLVWPFAVLIIGLSAVYKRCLFSGTEMVFMVFVLTVSALVLFSQLYQPGNEHFYIVITVMPITGLILFIRENGLLYGLLPLLSILFLYQLYYGYTQYF